jgi:putative tryptophan/tyrosine transport system substrate-binding protein
VETRLGRMRRREGVAALHFHDRRQLSLLRSLSFSAKLHSQSSSAPRSVVMAGAGDPVATGLVESLARSGGNVTGQSSRGAEVAGKSLPPLAQRVWS